VQNGLTGCVADANSKQSCGPYGGYVPMPPRVRRKRRLFRQAHAHPRKKRWGNRLIHEGVQARVDRTEQLPLGLEIFGATGTRLDMITGFAAQKLLTGSEGLDHLLLALSAIHRNFSASCFLAKNNLDFTVPMGTAKISETSASV